MPGLPISRLSTRQLGLFVLMASMSVLFLATLVAYVYTRLANPVWKTPEMPELPLGLVGSTLMLVGLSVAMHRAVKDAQRNRSETLVRDLWLALAFAVAFLAGQVLNWIAMAPGLFTTSVPHPLYPFTFYMLTGLHAAHVIGGFIPLGIVIGQAQRHRYTSSAYEGLNLCRQYWDYLGVVWLVLIAALFIVT